MPPAAAIAVPATEPSAPPLMGASAAAPSPNDAVPGPSDLSAKHKRKHTAHRPNDRKRLSKRPARLDESTEAPQHQQRQNRAGASKQQPASVPAVGNVYNVEKILKERNRDGRVEFFIRWAGYSRADDTWEPETNVRPNRPLESALFGHLHVPPCILSADTASATDRRLSRRANRIRARAPTLAQESKPKA